MWAAFNSTKVFAGLREHSPKVSLRLIPTQHPQRMEPILQWVRVLTLQVGVGVWCLADRRMTEEKRT